MASKTTETLIADVQVASTKVRELTKKVDGLEVDLALAKHALRSAEETQRTAREALLNRFEAAK